MGGTTDLRDGWASMIDRSGTGWLGPASFLCAVLVGLVAAAGCTRTSVPVGATPGSLPTGALPIPIRTGVPFGLGRPSETQFAVVWVPEGQTLAVRVPAGISGTSVAEFPYDDRGLALTGNALFLGSSLWVEVDSPAGSGWVNSWNLTESVLPDDFCDDARVVPVLQAFMQAVDLQDGQAMQRLASPKRGLVLRHDWWNPEVIIPPGDVTALFTDRAPRDWGVGDTLGSPVRGSFSEVFWPELAEMVRGTPTITCNSLVTGSTARPAQWPGEYANLSFYAFFTPDPASDTGFNWRTWAVAIEYVEGLPYIAVIVQFRGEV